MILPSGKEVFGKFMGLSLCEPDEWEEIKESGKGLEDFLADGKSIIFQDPIPLEKAITDGDQYNDVIDVIREELRRDHHKDLKEKGD